MLKNVIAILSFVVAVIICLVALYLPPQGEIDSSVLMAVGQFLLLTSTFLGVDSYIAALKDWVKKRSK